ncbi:hypothetical protein QZH41_000232 [Actinostola sp. cb2023]|nr:hypothetical protein QZH41_000232 [Actinostola sp. cb2023]
MSSKNLSKNEMSVLSKGLNFAPAPRKIPVEKFVIETESSISGLSPKAKSDIRNKVTNILASAKLPANNLTKDEKSAIRTLRDDKDIIILKADKGNATVVMDRTEYDNKIENMLSDTKTYKILPRDPAKSCETKLKAMLSKMKDKFQDSTYRSLCTTDAITPRLYGVPKIHKVDTPLRPIISYIGSTTYQLSKHLVTILSPLVGNTEQHLRNSKEWTNIAQTLTLDTNEELVSFDVVSLFTSIPTSIAVSAALTRLEQDLCLHERTSLTPADVTSLLSFCLSSTEFSFKGKYYQQIHGTAMGSPISVVVANLVMEKIESKALSTFLVSPRIFKRYVDDTICIIKQDNINAFHEHLNKQDVNIKFTLERYSDVGLPFLDTLNKVAENGTIEISIYRKKTHTDKYLDFNSHHPSRHKAAVVRTLSYRKENLLTDNNIKNEENIHICKSLSENGYPRQFIKKFSTLPKRNRESTVDDEFKGFAILPYVKGTTEKISRVLSRHKIRTCVKPHKTLREILSRPKDPVISEKQTGVVYTIPCGECDTSYIGETGRALGTRIKEHQASVRLNHPEKSALAEHAHTSGHAIDWNNIKIKSSKTSKYL